MTDQQPAAVVKFCVIKKGEKGLLGATILRVVGQGMVPVDHFM